MFVLRMLSTLLRGKTMEATISSWEEYPKTAVFDSHLDVDLCWVLIEKDKAAINPLGGVRNPVLWSFSGECYLPSFPILDQLNTVRRNPRHVDANVEPAIDVPGLVGSPGSWFIVQLVWVQLRSIFCKKPKKKRKIPAEKLDQVGEMAR